MSLWDRLLGLDSTGEDAGEWTLRWSAEPSGDAAFGMIVVATLITAVVVWLYRLERERISIGHRVIMATLRLAALGIGAAMLLGPVLVRQVEEEIPSHVVVLSDVSESMTVRDAWADETAGKRVAEAVDLDGLEALRETSRYELTRRVLSSGIVDALRGRSGESASPSDGEDIDTTRQASDIDDIRSVHVHPFGDPFER